MLKAIKHTRTLTIFEREDGMKIYATKVRDYDNKYKVDTFPKTDNLYFTLEGVHRYFNKHYGVVGEIFFDELNDWDKEDFITDEVYNLIMDGAE